LLSMLVTAFNRSIMHKVEELGLIHQERICCKVESAWPEDIIYFHV